MLLFSEGPMVPTTLLIANAGLRITNTDNPPLSSLSAIPAKIPCVNSQSSHLTEAVGPQQVTPIFSSGYMLCWIYFIALDLVMR